MDYEQYKKRMKQRGETLEDVIKKKSAKRKRDTERLRKFRGLKKISSYPKIL